AISYIYTLSLHDALPIFFLTQFFGGPNLYLEERGHPMLKRRHMEFEITPERKAAWLECMNKALHEAEIEEPYRSAIFERLTITRSEEHTSELQSRENIVC